MDLLVAGHIFFSFLRFFARRIVSCIEFGNGGTNQTKTKMKTNERKMQLTLTYQTKKILLFSFTLFLQIYYTDKKYWLQKQ
jgi:putative component of membrane protein insertase Oxa1/YidC/SpoIIIJ protein YidD